MCWHLFTNNYRAVYLLFVLVALSPWHRHIGSAPARNAEKHMILAVFALGFTWQEDRDACIWLNFNNRCTFNTFAFQDFIHPQSLGNWTSRYGVNRFQNNCNADFETNCYFQNDLNSVLFIKFSMCRLVSRCFLYTAPKRTRALVLPFHRRNRESLYRVGLH